MMRLKKEVTGILCCGLQELEVVLQSAKLARASPGTRTLLGAKKISCINLNNV